MSVSARPSAIKEKLRVHRPGHWVHQFRSCLYESRTGASSTQSAYYSRGFGVVQVYSMLCTYSPNGYRVQISLGIKHLSQGAAESEPECLQQETRTLCLTSKGLSSATRNFSKLSISVSGRNYGPIASAQRPSGSCGKSGRLVPLPSCLIEAC